MYEHSPIEWKMSFRLDDQTYVSDKAILLDQRVAFIDPLPPDGTEKQRASVRKRNYARLKEYWSRPVRNRFSFADLSATESDHFEGPEKVVLNQKYISFLLRRVPKKLLHFGMTGKNEDPVRIYRGGNCVGLLSPFLILPEFGSELIAMAKSGQVNAQMQLGRIYTVGAKNVPVNLDEAIKWLRRAAEQNSSDAFNSLGVMFFLGLGVDLDFTKSLMLLEQAIELGHKGAIHWRTILIRRMPPDQYKAASTKIIFKTNRPDVCDKTPSLPSGI